MGFSPAILFNQQDFSPEIEITLTPPPGTRAIGDPKAEKATNEGAFYDAFERNNFHVFSFRKVKYSKTGNCPKQDKKRCFLNMTRSNCSL